MYRNRDGQAAMSPESLASVLSRSAEEARHLAAELSQLDQAIGRALTVTDMSAIDGLQRTDAVRQRLEGLGQFLAQLALMIDPETVCHPSQAVAGIALRAQANRLAGLPASVPPGETGADIDIWGD